MNPTTSLFLSVCALSCPILHAQTAMFDINSDDQGNGLPGANLENWAALDIPNEATTGPFSATANGIVLTLDSTTEFRGRDRGTANTSQGTDNNDNAVPVGEFADMYRDFGFLLTGETLTGSLSGLLPNTNYFVRIISWDSGQGGTNESLWGPTGNASNPFSFSGDLVNNTELSIDPNTDLLIDKSIVFVIQADGSGEATFEGTSLAGAILAFNGVVVDVDLDADGLPDSFEQTILDASPNDTFQTIADVLPGDDFDSDLSDNLNEFTVGTDPTDNDSDDDDLLDGIENGSGEWTDATMTGTNPLDPDSDDDGLGDALENHDLAYNSANPTSQPGSDPNLFDTDEDGVSDGAEILEDSTDPTDPNSFFNPVSGTVAAFDFGPSDVQTGWIPAPFGAGSNGTVSVVTEALGGALIAERDRDTANTESGDVINNDMWRDFIFAQNSTAGSIGVGLSITLTGLAPSTIYPITIWAYDDATGGAGGASMLWAGQSITLTPNDPVSLSDSATRVRFEAISSANGTLIIEGVVGTEEPVNPTNNVFINGLVVGTPLGSAAPRVTRVVTIPDKNQLTLTWDSRPGVSYRIRVTSDLQGAVETWGEIADELPSGGMETSFTLPFNPGANPHHFYVVQEQE
ncbi:hypothetical protein V2O64_11715 [Verrucomicrobiaceae bacterium 227]